MHSAGRIILIEDDSDFAASFAQLLALEDRPAQVFRSPQAALDAIDDDFNGVVLANFRCRKMQVTDLLARLRGKSTGIPLIVLCCPEDRASARNLLSTGAFGVLTTPIDFDQFLNLADRALHDSAPEPSVAKVATPKPQLQVEPRPARHPCLLGNAPEILAINDRIAELTAGTGGILIAGESGTGKQYLARAISSAGSVARPFAVVDCRTMTHENFHRRLFGFSGMVSPVFTAAPRGALERAAGGTLYLDHFEQMPEPAQRALAATLDDPDALPCFRLIAATTLTTAEVGSLAASGAFHGALIDHIATDVVFLPPLRDRGDDVFELFDHFLRPALAQLGLPQVGLSASLTHYIAHHDWAGNVSELKASARSFAQATRAAVDDADRARQRPVPPRDRKVVEIRRFLGR